MQARSSKSLCEFDFTHARAKSFQPFDDVGHEIGKAVDRDPQLHQCLLHHSDRGSQYASSDYQDLLGEHGMTCSMSRKGNCWDNAVMRRYCSVVFYCPCDGSKTLAFRRNL